jgi:hypothetical protein
MGNFLISWGHICFPRKTMFHEFGWLKHSNIESHANNFNTARIFKCSNDSRRTDTVKWLYTFLKLIVAKM